MARSLKTGKPVPSPTPPPPEVELPPLAWKVDRLFRHPRHHHLSIQSLVNSILEGGFFLPDFQRPFVWTDDQVLRLLDSLRRGFHIGTIITWRQHVPVQQVSFGGIEVTTTNSGYGTLVVLDGQQRLGGLMRAMCSGRFFVNLLTAEFLVDPAPAPWLAPIGTVLAPFRLNHERHERLSKWAPKHSAEWGLARDVIEEVVCEMYGALERIYLSIVELDADYSRAEAIEMFVRLAKEGVPVSPEDLERALARLTEPVT